MIRKRKRIFSDPEAGRKTHPWWRYLLLLAVCLALIGGGYFYYFSKEIKSRFASRRWSVPARVFSATVPLYPGQAVPMSTLQQMLEQRSYRQGMDKDLHAGEYRLGPKDLEVYLREFQFPGMKIAAQLVIFHFERGKLVTIQGPQGPIPLLEMEPLDLARLFGSARESRLLINIKQVPRYLVNSVVAIEDHRYFEHAGIDWWGILRAMRADLRARSIVQGGSTITQQLVKNYFLNPERTLKRKVVEACMAIILESSYSKEEILEMYLNEIYLGQRGSAAIHGMGEAARYYFGRNVEDLTLPEAATLAGMIQAPNAYSPLRHLQACQDRRNAVLKRMLDLNLLPAADYDQARGVPVKVAETALPLKIAPYFVDYVRQQLQELYSPEVLESEGLAIYTTLQPEIAHAAEKAVQEGLEQLEQEHPGLRRDPASGPLQALMIVLQPKTGAVLALLGGRDYDATTFNRALYAHRQPGSAFKPFVYLAALDQFTPASWLSDELRSYRVSGQLWTPRNYDNRYRGQVKVRQALEESLNAATVQLALTVGLDKIVATARSLGIQSALEPVPSIALGALEVTPLELARAYATLDNEGQEPYLVTVKEVVTALGQVQQQRNIDLTSVTTAAKAYIITNLLEGVMQRGTAKSARSLGIDFPCAGKTGTSNDYQDAWFVGYTTDLLALVWVGFDDNSSMHLSGAASALRIWARFCNLVRPWIYPQPFRVPPGVVQRYVCTESGLLATAQCRNKQIEPFLADKVPDQFCGQHGNY